METLAKFFSTIAEVRSTETKDCSGKAGLCVNAGRGAPEKQAHNACSACFWLCSVVEESTGSSGMA